MTFTTRVCAFAALALVGIIAWQWSAATDNASDLTHLAVQQFEALRDRVRPLIATRRHSSPLSHVHIKQHNPAASCPRGKHAPTR